MPLIIAQNPDPDIILSLPTNSDIIAQNITEHPIILSLPKNTIYHLPPEIHQGLPTNNSRIQLAIQRQKHRVSASNQLIIEHNNNFASETCRPIGPLNFLQKISKQYIFCHIGKSLLPEYHLQLPWSFPSPSPCYLYLAMAKLWFKIPKTLRDAGKEIFQEQNIKASNQGRKRKPIQSYRQVATRTLITEQQQMDSLSNFLMITMLKTSSHQVQITMPF